MPQNNILHVIEPTLTGWAGHCHSFLSSICSAVGDTPLKLWIGRGATFYAHSDYVQIEPYFIRPIRRIQAFILYRRLLAQPNRIFISTATRIDLSLLHFAARGTIKPGQVFCYFHWFRPTPKKIECLKKLAGKQPNLVILGPTESAIESFRKAGFQNVRLVPYPITPRTTPENKASFRHLIFAGIARQDKGITRIADLVEHLAKEGGDLPVIVQASADHRSRYDNKTAQDIQRLENAGYLHLQLIETALPQDEYLALFDGGICLQPYDPADFADRISGISLDALSAGCPLIVTAGTWSAHVVERFGAGLVLDDLSASSLLSAIRTILANCATFQDKARHAGQTLQREYGASQLAEILTQT
jgi:glycosyltransferase involved in cell wall biosynthesis